MYLRLSPIVAAIAMTLPLVANAATPTIEKWNSENIPAISGKYVFSAKDLILPPKQGYYSPLEVLAGATGAIEDLQIDIQAIGPNDGIKQDKQIIGIEIQGGNPEFAGKSLDVSLVSDFVGGGNNQLTAIDIASKEDVLISADEVNLSVVSQAENGKSVYGIGLGRGGAELHISSNEVNINLQTSTVRPEHVEGENYYSEAIGIDVAGGKIVSAEDTVFNIVANSTGAETTTNGTDYSTSVYGVKFEGGQGDIAGTIVANVSAKGGNATGVGVTNYFYNTSLGENWNDSAAYLNSLTVNASSKTAQAAGIEVSYKKKEGEKNSVILNVDGETNLNATTESGKAYGISVTGDTTVAINGNLTATATATNGGKAYSVYLNEGSLAIAGAKTVLNGNVLVENAGAMQFGTPAKLRAQTLPSSVLLNGEMITKGGTTVTFNQTEVELGAGSSMDIQGTANSTQSSIVVNELLTDKKVVSVAGLSEQSTLGVVASSALNDKLSSDIATFANSLSVGGAGAANTTVTMREGLTADAVEGELSSDGSLNKDTVVKTKNTLMQSSLELASAAPLALNRIMMNDVRKRLGDIRTSNGTHGAWARYDGGKLSGEGGLENDFHTIQVGIDTVPTADAPRMGVAFSYTDSDAEYARGSADMKAYSLAMYSTWMGDNGQFFDLIGRMGTADTDMIVDGQHKGSMDNVALSMSGEFGWRFDVTDSIYVEPQVEATYTYVNEDSLSLSTANYDVDAVHSLLGRIGFAAGMKCPSDFGNVYVRASAVHEFLGDSKITGVNAGNTNVYEIDGKDTWFEYGIGANFNITKSTYMWADVERTTGGALDEDWRATVGVRYAW